MALGLELKLRMGMQLVMTPQLQMAIRLLQMSSLDLAEYLQEELEKNPLLEQEGENPREEARETSVDTPPDDKKRTQEEVVEAPPTAADPAENSNLPDDLPVDASWSDIYGEPMGGGGIDPSELPSLENTLSSSVNLQDHLIEQLGCTVDDDEQRALGMILIEAIDENGYLTSELDKLAELASVEEHEMEAMLSLIQSFDPPGICARSLAECLELQLIPLGLAKSPYTDLLQNLEDLARRDYRKLGRRLKLSEKELAEAVSVLLSLNPKPGLTYSSDNNTGYVIPDVHVRKHQGEWIVEVNPDTVPKLRLNRQYQKDVSKNISEKEKKFLTENARSAQWLIKSLEQRSSTIYRVAESIVRFQQEFLEDGPEYLKPLVLKDVADDIGVHESTASRVTSNKYMHTPQGIFELKYFFSSSLSSRSGQAHSSEAVKYKIRKLVESEPAKKPFSDEKLAKMLQEQGIKVARRTVAKYREAMSIPASSRRKRLT
ncbi:RNA polymerase factor sigma-54 [Magnetococcales bacterium HHB-1]